MIRNPYFQKLRQMTTVATLMIRLVRYSLGKGKDKHIINYHQGEGFISLKIHITSLNPYKCPFKKYCIKD